VKHPMKSFLPWGMVLVVASVFGPARAQHDSLSCRPAFNSIMRQKRDMQTLLEYSEKEFYARLPVYSQNFRAFLDSLDRYRLWSAVPDPLELQIEKVRLDFYGDPTPEKRAVRPAVEKIVGELRKSNHRIEFAEFSNYLGAMYFQEGRIDKNVSLYRDAIRALEESREGAGPPSMLEWMIRAKLANLLCKSEPAAALGCIEGIEALDVQLYRDYAANPWRRERLENTVSSAWEALGNVYSCLGDAQRAVFAYRNALKYTQPARITWDSVILSLVNTESGLEDSTGVRRLIDLARREKPENLSSIYLVAGYAFAMKGDLEIASEFYRDAFESLGSGPKDEQVKTLSNLVNVYSEMQAEDLIYKTLNALLKDPAFMADDNLAYRYCQASIDIGNRIQKGRKDYFSGAEKILVRKAAGRDFIRDPYAGKFLILASRLYLSRRGRGDLEKAETALNQIVAGNLDAAKKLNLPGEYGSDDVVFAKLNLAKIHEINGNLPAAQNGWRELVSDYAEQRIRGSLEHHQSRAGVDSSVASLLKISDAFLKKGSFAEALDICAWLSRRQNLPAALRETAEFKTGRVYYHWGFSDRSQFQQALVVFNGISGESSRRLESRFLAALCLWNLDFRRAAVDELSSLYGNLEKAGGLPAGVAAFLTDENVIGYTRMVAESVFMQGESERAQSLLEAVLVMVSEQKFDTPEEAKTIYDLAKFCMHGGFHGKETLLKVQKLLEEFFANKYAEADPWTYFRAGELKMDLDFELGTLTALSIQRQIDRLRDFNDSKEALQKIVESENFYRGPGFVSLEDLDANGLREKVQELLAKCYYILGRVNGRQERWADAMKAYDTVLGRYARFDLYASHSLYYKGIIYLTALNQINHAVELFTRLFKQYDRTEIALQAEADLREAGRFAEKPGEISSWFNAGKRMYQSSTVGRLSKFALDLCFYLAERHVGEEDRFTRNRAVMSAVVKGMGWAAFIQDTALIRSADVTKANFLLARAYRLESDLRSDSFFMKYGVTYPADNAKKENGCYRRILRSTRNPDDYGEAQWRLTVNLALTGRPEESKAAAWVYQIPADKNSSLRKRYEKEIGILIAYLAPRRTGAYNTDVRIAVENLIEETRPNGLLPHLENIFATTMRQVEILKLETRRQDIKPELLDLNKYPNGKWIGDQL
jgi:hypothetical protein